jgi:hypothetical protein
MPKSPPSVDLAARLTLMQKSATISALAGQGIIGG